MKAKEIMTKEPITCLPQTTIEDLCETLRRENINGAPVVDEAGRLVGIVSQDDVIFRKGRQNEEIRPPRDIKDLFQRGFASIADSDTGPRRVEDIMTREVIVGLPQDPQPPLPHEPHPPFDSPRSLRAGPVGLSQPPQPPSPAQPPCFTPRPFGSS